jgi:hypothetical protein
MLTLLADLTPASAVCLSVSVYAVVSIPVLLVPADVDPRPAVRRALAVGHQGLVHAGHDLNRATATVQRAAGHVARDTALTVAALLILTIPTGDRS